MGPARRRLAPLLLLAIACGPSLETPARDGSTGEPVASTSSASVPTTTTSMSTTAGDGGPTSSADDTTDDAAEGDFLLDPDLGSGSECDVYAQDCPAGFKCSPYATRGGAWDAWGCFPVPDQPAVVGGLCTATDSGTSGIDSCEVGAMCWDVDPENNQGVCIALCVGNALDPFCEDPQTGCLVYNDGILPVCLERCHPLVPEDCPRGLTCYPIGGSFTCAPDGEIEGFAGAPCEFVNACDPGHACIEPERVPDCPSMAGCCSAWCDLNDPMPECLLGQGCVPWFDRESPPPGFETLGICSLPR